MARRQQERSTVEVVAGRNPVVEALRAGVPAQALYIAETVGNDARVAEATRLADAADIAVHRVPRTQLDRTAGRVPHQGLLLAVRAYEYADPRSLPEQAASGPALLVALDGVTDPHNLGAVVRSATAFGCHGMLLAERRAAGMTAAAWKASAGTAAAMPVGRTVNLTRQLDSYRKAGMFVIGLAGDGEIDLPDSTLLDGPLVLVVGGEGNGLSRLVRETCDQVARIPMSAGTESLNASVAAAVALYEVARHRTT